MKNINMQSALLVDLMQTTAMTILCMHGVCLRSEKCCLQTLWSVNSSCSWEGLRWECDQVISDHCPLYTHSSIYIGPSRRRLLELLCAWEGAGWLVERRKRILLPTFHFGKARCGGEKKSSLIWLARTQEFVNVSGDAYQMLKLSLVVAFSPFFVSPFSVVAESPVHKAMWHRRWRKVTMVSWNMFSVDSFR